MNKFFTFLLVAIAIPAGSRAQTMEIPAQATQQPTVQTTSPYTAEQIPTQQTPVSQPAADPIPQHMMAPIPQHEVTDATQPQTTTVDEHMPRSEYAATALAGQEREQKSGFFPKGLQLGVGAGILGGANFQLGYRIPHHSQNFWKNRLAFRLDYNTTRPFESMVNRYSIEVDEEKFTPHIKGKQFGTLVDFYPFSYTWFLGGLRLSGGYYIGEFALGATLTTRDGGEFSIRDIDGIDITYTVNGSIDLTSNISYDRIRGPYAGMGFDMGLLWGLKLYFDAGVVFTQKPDIVASIAGHGTITVYDGTSIEVVDLGNLTSQAQTLLDQLLDDTKREFEEELDQIRKGYFPIVKLGLLYRF